MARKGTNDQQHIIDALMTKNYKYVWEQVKYIGYLKVADINTRYMIFCDIVEEFDYVKNNNFICFYTTRLGYYTADECSTYYVSRNRNVINNLKSENISPTECKKSKITRQLKDWSN
jgi:hypothetical protein